MPAIEKKNVIVTGGAGFIGSHLIEELLKDGCSVICIDNFLTSTERNIDHLLRFPDFEFIRHDINIPIDLLTHSELERFKVRWSGIQEVYHLAAPTSVKDFTTLAISTLQTHALGTINALELAKRYGAKILLASSAVVYGPRPKHPTLFDENMHGVIDQLSPRACYDEGKRFSETCGATYTQAFGLDVRIARIFRTYGPRMKLFDAQMIPDFIINALENKDLIIFGDENFSSSLVFVSDVVTGLMKLMTAPEGIGPVNFGSDEDLRLHEVAKKIISLTASTSKVKFAERLLFMSELGLPNISKARDTLGWMPLVRLEEGLKKTIEYAKAHRFMVGSF